MMQIGRIAMFVSLVTRAERSSAEFPVIAGPAAHDCRDCTAVFSDRCAVAGSHAGLCAARSARVWVCWRFAKHRCVESPRQCEEPGSRRASMGGGIESEVVRTSMGRIKGEAT